MYRLACVLTSFHYPPIPTPQGPSCAILPSYVAETIAHFPQRLVIPHRALQGIVAPFYICRTSLPAISGRSTSHSSLEDGKGEIAHQQALAQSPNKGDGIEEVGVAASRVYPEVVESQRPRKVAYKMTAAMTRCNASGGRRAGTAVSGP